jgi:hypothetical protein
MIFMLQQLDLVSKTEVDNILQMFDAADVNGDGVLDVADIRRRLRLSGSVSTGTTPEAMPFWSQEREASAHMLAEQGSVRPRCSSPNGQKPQSLQGEGSSPDTSLTSP